MNAFERHKITHLSASSLNLYQDQPLQWIGRYLCKWQDNAGPAMRRGTAVEAGLDHWLYSDRTPDALEAAQNVALDNFALNTNGQADDAHEHERELIPPMVAQAAKAAANLPQPLARQLRVELWADGIEVPIIGYVDYVMENGGIVDLKTTKAMPSQAKPEHLRQMAVYQRARNADAVSLLYVTPKKHKLEPVTAAQCEAAFADLVRAARALRALLVRSRDAQDAASVFVPDFTNYRWSPETIKLAHQDLLKEKV